MIFLKKKIESYKQKFDPMREIDSASFKEASQLTFSHDPRVINKADFVIIAVPTAVDNANIPDFSPLKSASLSVGTHLKKGAIVVYESTVYPGATEDICVPLIEQASGLKWGDGFFIGYSPERINPGDKEHSISSIIKVVSGDNAVTTDKLITLYDSIILAGTHRAGSIKIAEASKVIENTQRDLNIALMNELAVIFDRMAIDTSEVLEAACTKWNFLPFSPGLVGGHCIGVDPYYLTHKAEMLGYHPEVILAGRRINDQMAEFVAQKTVKKIIASGHFVNGAKVSVLGLTFKENCGDLRNSKVVDLVNELQDFGCDVSLHDPLVEPAEAEKMFGMKSVSWEELPSSEAIVMAVPHREFKHMPIKTILALLKPEGIFIDIKSAFPSLIIKEMGYEVWRL